MNSYKYLIIGLILTTCMSINAQNTENLQFTNNGFEQWVNEGSASVEPVHWHSFKTATGSYSGLMSQQIEPSNIVRSGTSGVRSVRIYPKSIVGVTANGNLTSGRINAGSMDPSGTGNYNYTQRSNADFSTPINMVPDSLTLWVCFRATSSNTQASVAAVIHGDADFQSLGDGGYVPADMLCARANKFITRTSASESKDYVWQRVSVPFVSYPEICSDYRYILATFSTNKDAGSGNTSDELFVDDILLIYNPSLRVEALAHNEFVIHSDGSSLSVEIPFALTGTMSPENINAAHNEVIAQLSDANGSFENPVELGRVTTDESGVIQGVIPNNVIDGGGYRIRVVSTNYPMVSDDNGTDLQITHEGEDWINIDVVLNNDEAGYVTGNGYYVEGQEVTLMAYKYGWFSFAAWLEDGDTISKENPYSFVAEQDRVITAAFLGSTDVNEMNMPVIGFYPNPVKDMLHFTSDQQVTEIVIYSIDGKKVIDKQICEQENQIDLKSLCRGTYIIKVCTDENVVMRRVIVM